MIAVALIAICSISGIIGQSYGGNSIPGIFGNLGNRTGGMSMFSALLGQAGMYLQNGIESRISGNNASQECQEDFHIVLQGVATRQKWALRSKLLTKK